MVLKEGFLKKRALEMGFRVTPRYIVLVEGWGEEVEGVSSMRWDRYKKSQGLLR